MVLLPVPRTRRPSVPPSVSTSIELTSPLPGTCLGQAGLCYDLLGKMVRGGTANYTALHRLLATQHQASSHKAYPGEYWPCKEDRSEGGHVGLLNLGAT